MATWLLAGACLLFAACSSAPRVPRTASGASLSTRLAVANAENGSQIFWKCAACHALRPGGTGGDGPNLWGVLGRPIASAGSGYAYTAALRATGGSWTCARIDRWLADPQRFAPGTVMGFAGLPDGDDRADVIAWLARNGGAPIDAECQGLRGYGHAS